ncbi:MULTISPECIES: acyl-CoA dehydrogenase family protein [Bacillus]|uniref:acyl-CoA dehydrogenase family protein n=1 Tax=Bacillus TaxID=1386 RepID=UPI001F5674E9|nr:MULTISPECIES: acyl-CoA dehydrogenase family protein [Bacillus cereus group]USL15359.1 acyl-CoA/acyl-ACP dehydrogenase [Bacillus thuringiensis]
MENPKLFDKDLTTVLGVISKNARKIDKGIFPIENIELLKKNKLMSMIMYGNSQQRKESILRCSKLVQEIGEHCLSTSMIYGMHCQQLFTLLNIEETPFKKMLLKSICDNQSYIASVTSEYGKGGHLLTSTSPIEWLNENIILNRRAPVVTGGAFADGYLITMKKSINSNEDDVTLVFAFKDEIQSEVKGKWSSLGMRGTQSIPMKFHGILSEDRVLNSISFKEIAKFYMIPIGHIMWASSWLGSIKSAFKRFIRIIRKDKTKRDSEIILSKISEIRLLIDTVDIYLKSTIEKFIQYLEEDKSQMDWNSFSIQINNLKIISSENLYKAINEIVEVSGMYYGYQQIEEINFERTLRDLRSASIMFHNNRLKGINGKLSLFNSEIN